MTKLFISIFSLLFSFTNTIFISGHFKDIRKIKPISTANRQIILMAGEKIIAKTETDSTGYYELNFLDTYSRTNTLKFYYMVNKNKDTILLKSITKFSSDTPVIDFFVGEKN